MAVTAFVFGAPAVFSLGAPPAGALQTLSMGERAGIANAYTHFFSPSVSVAQVRASVEAGTVPLAVSLRKAAAGFLAGFTQGEARMAVRVRTVAPFRANVARVGFELRIGDRGGTYTQRFTGAAVHTNGRWQVGWATACFLAETHAVLCPRAPGGITALPLPEAALPARFQRPTLPGLVWPSALAVAPDGSLLIVDTRREQVFRRLPDGHLRLLAGTGKPGFAGDGGPAVTAELKDPAALAVAKDGSVYVADSGNGRVRVIAPNGAVRSLAGRFKWPSGLALAPNGDLYLATSRSVDRVTSSGRRTTFARGHGRFDQISVGGKRYGGFSPSWLALDRSGDLYAFSFGTKTIFAFSPTGKPLRAWQAYANGLAEAPDGSIVIAEHGGRLLRIRGGQATTIVDLTKTRIAGYPSPGHGTAFDPD